MDAPSELGPPDPRPGARRRARALLAAGAALASLLGAEGLCRILGAGDPPRVYEPARAEDGTALRRAALAGSVPVAVTREFLEAKPPGRVRLVFVGESTVTGFPFPPSVAFPARVEAALRKAGIDAEALNVSAPGIGIAEARRRAEEMAGYGADLLVVYAGSNEFFPWNLRLDRERRARPFRTGLREMLLGLRIARWLAPLEPALAGTREGPLEVSDADRIDSRARCRRELARIAETCRGAGVPLLFVLPGANLRDAVPKARRDYGDPGGIVARTEALALERLRERDLAGARAALEEALRAFPDHPLLHFGLGRTLLDMGRPAEARGALESALDLDALPFRLPPDVRGILEEGCARERVPLLDGQRVLDAADPTGIAGDAVFVDHVHPGAEGHLLLARAILGAIADDPALARPFPPGALRDVSLGVEGVSLSPEEEEAARRTEMVYLFPRAYSAAGLDPALAGRVRGLLERAARAEPPDSVAELLLGLLEIRAGAPDSGRSRLRSALGHGALERLEPGLLPSIGETPDTVRALAGG